MGKNIGLHHQVLKRQAKKVVAEPVFLQTLPPHNLRILIQRHRGGAGVLVVFEKLAGQVAALFGEEKYAGHVAHAERLLHPDEMLALEHFQRCVDQAEGKPNQAADIAAHQLTAKV